MLVASSTGLDDHSTGLLDLLQSGQESLEQPRTSAFLLLIVSDLGDDECAAEREGRDDTCPRRVGVSS